jgi:colicin import membrane protein
MSRGITREQVFEAAQALTERGESVTIANVRRELGDTGSFSTIHEALRAWRDQHRPEQPPAISEALDAVGLALRKVWGAAWGAAQSALSSERESLEAERGRLELEREELLAEIARLEEELEAARSEAPSASRTAAATAARVAKAKAAREAKAAVAEGADVNAGGTAELGSEPQPEAA